MKQKRRLNSKNMYMVMQAALLAVCMLLATPAMGADYSVDYAYRLDKVSDYLLAQVNTDGGMPSSKGEESNASTSSFALMALSSYGKTKSAPEVLRLRTYLANGLSKDLSLVPTLDLARYLMAVGPAGARAGAVGDALQARRLKSGQYGLVSEEKMVNAHVWSILALKKLGRVVSDQAVDWLIGAQNADGGFSFTKGAKSDPDSTGVALAALGYMGLRSSDKVVERAAGYLARQVGDEGGMNLSRVGENTASDAWAAMGLLAVGIDPRTSASFDASGRDLMDHLVSMQSSTGWFFWRDGDDANKNQMSAYAMLAMSAKPFGLDRSLRVGPEVSLYVNGTRVPADVAPRILSGRTLVPVSFVAGALGADVKWEAATKTVRMTYQGKSLTLVIDEEIPGLGTPRILSGRTMVPVRYVAQSFGKTVNYVSGSYETRVTVE